MKPVRDFNGDGTSDLLFETADIKGRGFRSDWLIEDGTYAAV